MMRGYETHRSTWGPVCPRPWRDLSKMLAVGRHNLFIRRLCEHCGAIKTPLRTVRKGR